LLLNRVHIVWAHLFIDSIESFWTMSALFGLSFLKGPLCFGWMIWSGTANVYKPCPTYLRAGYGPTASISITLFELYTRMVPLDLFYTYATYYACLL